jgi:hypothetical protein
MVSVDAIEGGSSPGSFLHDCQEPFHHLLIAFIIVGIGIGVGRFVDNGRGVCIWANAESLRNRLAKMVRNQGAIRPRICVMRGTAFPVGRESETHAEVC